MTALQTIAKKGTDSVKKLRLQKLASGQPFMINSKDLESHQCYLEYPDGTIKLVFLNRSAKEFTVIRILTLAESRDIRKKYRLSER